MQKLLPIVLLTSFAFAGCTWVELKPEGEAVRVASGGEVGSCKRIGTATSVGVDEVGFITRSEEKLSEELQTLARNEAATMGGNTVVADSEIVEGRQTFVVYQCP